MKIENIWLIATAYILIAMFPTIIQLMIEFIVLEFTTKIKSDGVAMHFIMLHQKHLLTLVLITIINKSFGLKGFFVTLLIYLLSSHFVNNWHKIM